MFHKYIIGILRTFQLIFCKIYYSKQTPDSAFKADRSTSRMYYMRMIGSATTA